MTDWAIFVPTFLAACVEWVEAFTIVLAVSLSIGWARATSAAVAALGVLAVMTVVTGGVLQLGVGLSALELIIGVLLLLFGVRWLAKAMARQAGMKALHDEDKEFVETREILEKGDRAAAWVIAFKGVLLEGLEVWLIVVALGVKSAHPMVATEGALTALLVVVLAGAAIRAPLRRVPENAIKFLVGTMIVSFGTYWTLESIGGEGIWPFGDWALLILFVFYLLGGLSIAMAMRTGRRKEAIQ
ncbi:MAG: hypothetical protein KGJ79_13975 [Alphaproteobacteria bacterium]|nr:hypothetical protein [Alphaproteobacteria bacterium]MDE2112248.1 hypothetical protein [Alphaproteobacteria bacterium]MDE2494180.1 hypothetical protein [Alphaproteobacteria bacterium]